MSGTVLFGKLPAHGDFVARGLDAPARDRLDGWLSAALAEARTAAGDGFDQRWDEAPPWRFVRPAGGGWQAGVVAPSVDRVGRRFPVLLARATGAVGAAALAGALEEVLGAAFVGGWDGDRLCAAAADAPASAGPAPAAARWWVADAAGDEAAGFAPSPAGAWPADLLCRMMAVAA